MPAITVVSWGIAFLLYYVAIALACGAAAQALTGRDAAAAPATGTEQRQILASFLLGTGFAPFIIGGLHLALLLLFDGFPFKLLAALHLAVAAFALFWARGPLATVWRNGREAWGAHRKTGWATLVLGGVCFAWMACYMGNAVIRPVWHGDTLIYLYESKAIRDGQSYCARLKTDNTPNAHNYLRGNNHPLVYIGFLNAGHAFSPDRTQDLSVRLALQMQNLAILTTLFGLGLRIGARAALMGPVFFLFAAYFGALIGMGSRTGFEVVPLLLVFGFFPAKSRKLGWKSPNTWLLFSSFLFLWYSHSSSLLYAPLLFVCLLPFLSGWRSRGVMTSIFLLAFLLGGSHFIDAYFATGSPLGYEQVHYNTRLISPPTGSWLAKPTPPPGISRLMERLQNQAQSDGAIAVGLLFAALLLLPFSRPLPPPLLGAWLFLLLCELQILGFFDFAYLSLSSAYFRVPRFRFPLYPVAAYLEGFLFYRWTRSLEGKKGWVSILLAALLLVGGLATSWKSWERSEVDPLLVQGSRTLARLDKAKSCWATVEKTITAQDGNVSGLILTDSGIIPWYYTDHNVIAVADPRLETARMAYTWQEALKVLDALGVRWIVLNKARFLAGTALDVAIMQSGAYEKAGECIYDNIYRRIPSFPSPVEEKQAP